MKEIIALIEAGDLDGAEALINRSQLSGEESQIVNRTLQRAKERARASKAKAAPKVESSELKEKPKTKKAEPTRNPPKKSSQKGKK